MHRHPSTAGEQKLVGQVLLDDLELVKPRNVAVNSASMHSHTNMAITW